MENTARSYLLGALIIVLGPPLLAQPAVALFKQQGMKLVGTTAIPAPYDQGRSVSLSGNGSTALVGGPSTDGSGAVWFYTRSAGQWAQQTTLTGPDLGDRLGTSVALSADGTTALVGGPTANSTGFGFVYIPTSQGWGAQARLSVFDNIGSNVLMGYSVALSADGNTALLGGPDDNGGIGAAWVFTRSNGQWTEQAKLVATGQVGGAHLGWSVSLSADGNTALVGGPSYNLQPGCSVNCGAAWVFTRSNGIWAQQGQPLIGAGAVGSANQGFSVALSGDGNTALIGGYTDQNLTGAVWVFTRGNAVWNQQGNKLVGTGAAGAAFQGIAVALTGDGNTAVVGGSSDNNDGGAAWVFARSNGGWAQQGPKLVGSGAAGQASQGSAIAVSSTGNTAIIGGVTDSNEVGAAWVFVNTTAHDFDGDGFSDIAWRDASGNAAGWLINGGQVVQAGALGQVPLSWSIVGQHDFDGIGRSEWLWRDSASGDVAIWLLNGLQVAGAAVIGAVPMVWSVAGTADFDGDRIGDILWRNTGGDVAIWLMANDASVLQIAGLGNVPPSWSIAGTADFNGDGKADILWHDSSGNVAIWLMNGVQVLQASNLGQVPTNWSVVGTGDFNGDGKWDILWRDTAGNVAIWLMNGPQVLQIGNLGQVPPNWVVAQTGDFNGDGMSDILWRDTTGGTVVIWFMNGVQVAATASLGVVGLNWTIQGLNAD